MATATQGATDRAEQDGGSRTAAVRTARARAANAKDMLAFLEELQPGTTAHMRAALPVGVVEAIEKSARTDWIPVELDGIFATEIMRWLGEDRSREAWRRYASERFIKSPAIRALAEGAVRVFGLSVRSFVRMIPIAFAQGFRECGEVDIHWGDRDATVTLRDIAPEMARHRAYAVQLEGVFTGIYDLVGVAPQLKVREAFSSDRTLTAFFRW